MYLMRDLAKSRGNFAEIIRDAIGVCAAIGCFAAVYVAVGIIAAIYTEIGIFAGIGIFTMVGGFLAIFAGNGVFAGIGVPAITGSDDNLASSSCSPANSLLSAELQNEFNGIKNAGSFLTERVLTSSQGIEIRLKGRDRPLLNFCSNNYLGLTSHPAVIQAGKDALDEYGAGLSSVRLVCGTQDLHHRLEKALARFHGREDAILYTSCYDANVGLFEAITGTNDAIISDQLNHASVIAGIRLSRARRLRYKHMDMDDLEKHLKATKDCRRRIIATDGVFSMDGEIAPLREIFALADKYNAVVFVDDSHATGFVGKTGRGTEELCGVLYRSDIINSTLGKAIGGVMGGYTTGSRELINLLRQRSLPYVYSNSLAPAVVGSSLKAVELLSNGKNEFAKSLIENVVHFRAGMISAGFQLLGSDSLSICPIIFGEAQLAKQFAEALLEEGIYVIGVSYPVVPKGMARIRVVISAAHSLEQIDRCVSAFKSVGKKLGVI